ncbi:MAG TPA: type VI secretion protein IcmF/TssM N-terminal domain-containing protein [Tepidisphaeraceae bacterium]|jgi:GTP-binding protein EngB required for normal cell division
MTTLSTPSAGDRLTGPLAMAITVLGGGALVAAAYLFGFRPGVLLILLAAVAVALVLLLLLHLLVRWITARKSRPFTQTVQRAAGDTPNAISSPGGRAKLDDLRRNFEAGLAKFHAAGKDIYKLPWYLLVGEAGSGKTEAIRHSSIPFPPGLQDQLQGAGGTVNMNWWFTNDAVILDTAGRYMFEEVQAGASGEWTEFLRLLLRNRPQCPINGLLLVIPANSLILDTADQIESKGGQIAQQLDRIQRTLEVRFPVYIVVTKCDLVNGFREFFDGLNDPRLQHQILGWSNPAPLDQPFNPELVDEHLKQVAGKLSMRRMGLLLDPVARESETSRRIDEVDSLYSLPESFLRLGPRLRRYLEMIFVAGEWSPKPLFLRGIYFTSSMREGQAIDAELMELLHVPPESLREGRLWERDRAFFLRDLFLKKVFAEKGLVTRAASTRKLQRTRRVAILGGGFVAAALLIFFTWFGNQKLRESIVNQGAFWAAMADQADNMNLAIVAPGQAPRAGGPTTAPVYRSRLDEQVPRLGRDSGTIGDLYRAMYDFEQKPIYIHPVLRPAARLLNAGADLNQKKAEDYRRIYVANALTPLLDATGRKIAAQGPPTWDASATAALVQMVHCRAGAGISLDPLLRYVAPDGVASDRFRDRYSPALQDGLAFVQPPGGKSPVGVDPVALTAGVDRFIRHWNGRLAQSSIPFQVMIASTGPVDSVRKAQTAMDKFCIAACKSPPLTTDAYTAQVKGWREIYGQYTTSCKALDAQLNELSGGQPAASLAALYATRYTEAQEGAKAEFDALLNEFPPTATSAPAAADAPADPAAEQLAALRQQLQHARDGMKSAIDATLVADLKKLDDTLLKVTHSPDGQPIRSYALVDRVYGAADAPLPAPDSLSGTASAAADDPNARLKSAHDAIDGMRRTSSDDVAAQSAAKNADILLSSVAEPAVRYQSVARQLAKAPATADAIKSGVAERASADPAKYAATAFPAIAFVTWPAAQPGFHPAAAADCLADLKPLLQQASIQPPQATGAGDCAPTTILNANELAAAGQHCRDAVAAYLGDYARYWNAVLDQKPQFRMKDSTGGTPRDLDWAGLRQKLPLGASNVDNGFGQLARLLDTAVQLPTVMKGYVVIAEPVAFDRIAQEAKGAEAALKAAEDKPAADPYAGALRLWQDLGDDPGSARTQLLGRTARQLADAYMLVPLDDTDFVTRYWRAVSGALLAALIHAPDPAAQSVTDWRNQHHAFPIGPIANGELTLQQLDELRNALQGVLLPGKPTGKPDDSILAGGRLPGSGRPEVDALNGQLDKLANGALAPQDQAQLRLMARFLDSLPAATDTSWACAISLPGDKKQDELRNKYTSAGTKAKNQWPAGALRLEVNHKPVAARPVSLAVGGDLGEVQYPGDPFQFALFAYPSDANPDQSLPADPALGAASPGRWECLRLLTGAAHVSAEDPTAFYVELTPVFKGQRYSLWVMLKFKKPLPEYSSNAWPK